MLRASDRCAIEKALVDGHMGTLVRLPDVLDCIFETPEALTGNGYVKLVENLMRMMEERRKVENSIACQETIDREEREIKGIKPYGGSVFCEKDEIWIAKENLLEQIIETVKKFFGKDGDHYDIKTEELTGKYRVSWIIFF